MTHTIEIKSALSDDYVDVTDAQIRNVTGSALQSIANYAWESPGIVRFTVDSIVAGISASVSLSAGSQLDEDHPLLASSPITFDITPGNATLVADYGSYAVDVSIQVGDVWEVGYGYEWDATDGEWHPAADFGVVAPGETSRTLTMKVTNSGLRTWINTFISAVGDGADYVAFRPAGEEWSSDSGESVSYLTESGYAIGQVTPGGSVECDLKVIMGANEDASSNPMLPEILVTYTEI